MESLLLVQLTMANWPGRNLSEETRDILVYIFFSYFYLSEPNRDTHFLLVNNILILP